MESPGDLFALVADRDIEQAISGLLSRTHAIGIQPLKSVEIRPFARHDGGCRTEGVSVLRTLRKQFRHALLVFDFDGSGSVVADASALERSLESELAAAGWGNDAAVVIIEPEIEAWVWSSSSKVEEVLEWKSQESLRDWLRSQSLLTDGHVKPHDPKQALRATLRKVGRKPSSSIFKELAEKVSWKGCTDRSFIKLLSTLQAWFPNN